MTPRKKVPRVAKAITSAMATWSFILCFIFLFAAWAGWNNFGPVHFRFDPYPFILFNLFLSFIAAIQGSVIMIYQKYADAENEKRDARIDKNSVHLVKVEKEHGKKLDEILERLSKHAG